MVLPDNVEFDQVVIFQEKQKNKSCRANIIKALFIHSFIISFADENGTL